MALNEAVLMLARIGAYFPRAELPKVTLAAWAERLCCFEAEDLAAGIVALAEESVHEPRLAEIIDACREAREQRAERERLARPRLVASEGRFVSSDEGAEIARRIRDSIGRPIVDDPDEERTKRERAKQMHSEASDA